MKTILPLLMLAALPAAASPQDNIHFIRQHQQGTNVVWDMPVPTTGQAPSALALESGGSLFQLWSIAASPARDYLLDQKLVGAYMPKAEIKVVTLDPDGKIPRTRVDQPFRVEIQVSDLLTGTEFPLAASSVLLERHVASYSREQTVLDPVAVISSTPMSSGYLTANGQHVMAFQASGLTASDPTKACGEEHFVIHALPDGNIAQSQIASAMVQVWPVASGEIKGITTGDNIRFQLPQVELLLNDLYPRSDTYLLLFEGTQTTGTEGTIIKAFPMDRETSASHVLRVSELESKLTDDGTYTLVLVSETVFGREMLCDPVTFNIRRTIQVNAMQVVGASEQAPSEEFIYEEASGESLTSDESL
ncbi:MAG: hypothetical protein EHM17_07360 [Verrucomicrobiaceae bacterium]|nr:MAG: hypothetical protein EHM17_07360 [Verrucomicrobiaceae bacterium]